MSDILKSNDMCVHVWAQQNQDKGQTSNGNIFFEGATIYSYGYHFPLATFLNDYVVINSDSYSMTTSSHQTLVRGAVSHYQEIYVPTNIIKKLVDVQRYGLNKEYKKFLKAECIKYLNDLIDTQVNKAARRRKSYLAENDIAEAVNSYHQITKLFQALKIKMPVALTRNIMSAEGDRTNVLEAAKKRQQREEIKREQKALSVIKRFKQNKQMSYEDQTALRHLKTIYMRPVSDIEIATTHGARFPIDAAKKAFKFILECKQKDIVFDCGRGDKQIRLGHFTIDKIHNNGDVIAGCHYVEFSEIERNAKMLNLI